MVKVKNNVVELNGITSETISEETLYSPTPLLLKGFCKTWPIVQSGLKSEHQAASYLRKVYSGEPVSGCLGAPENKGRVFYNDDMTGFNFSASKIDLNLVLDKLLQHLDDTYPPTMYVASTDANRWFPELVKDNNFTIPNHTPITSLWIGNQSKIAPHWDFPTNVACNVVGKRRFILFPTDQIGNLYPGPLEFAPGGQEISMVDFANPDYKKFPKFKDALESAFIAELEPGDALILPSMWWHYVEGLSSFNVLITHWWRDSPGYLGRPHNALLAAVLAIRSLPKIQRQNWKHIFAHYIFNDELDLHEHIPEHALDVLNYPLDEMSARKLRADLLNKLKR